MVAAKTTLKTLLDPIDPRCRERVLIELRTAARRANKPCIRNRVQFALEEIVLPEGRHKGELLREEFQPFAIDLLRQMDATEHRRYAITGCVQSGKTLVALVVNLCWHLFERGHAVIYGVPEMKMAKKKWLKEILPVINKNPRFRRMLPDSGSGSKGGFDGSIEFKNGATLEFMGATGNDSRRSSSTGQVLFKTEVDRFDAAAESSREASPAVTMEDRVSSYGDDFYIYEECTRTDVTGRINVVVNAGTGHKPHGLCPHCEQYVYPTREHLVGVEDCADVIEARKSGTFICPECSVILSPEDRRLMQTNRVSFARTQKATLGSDGTAIIEGELPKTDVFSYEWNAFQNRFWTTSQLAAWEYSSITGLEAEDEDKQAKQKRWSEPATPTILDLSRLTLAVMVAKTADLQRTVVPLGTKFMSAGCDVRGTQLHYVVRAWTQENNRLAGHAVDIGFMNVDRDELGAHDAVLDSLRRFRDRSMSGLYRDEEGKSYVPGWTLIDAGWKERWIWEFTFECAQQGFPTWIPVLGRGQSDPSKPGTYRQPDKIDTEGKNRKIYWIGDECHLRKSSKYASVYASAGSAIPPLCMFVNTDEGKGFLRDGYNSPVGTNGSLTTFKPGPSDERKVIQDHRKQLLAEKETQVVIAGRGVKRKFTNDSNIVNHYGDCDNYCCFAAQLCGAPVSQGRTVQHPETSQEKSLTMPDGRPYMAASRN